jgi:hypothetical protein
MTRFLLLFAGFLILFSAEILRVYLIMPFPGSQQHNTIDIAYFISNNINWLRALGLLLVVLPLIQVFKQSRYWKKILLSVVVVLYIFIIYLFNFKFVADKMFYQPKNKLLASVGGNKVDTNKLVIGAVINGQAKAYPLEIIGYHHQVLDTIGGDPVLVTYCTVCRTGAVFSPMINDKYEHFRLVGMDHFNAMFEDEKTNSWWRQVNGMAIAGPLKGNNLKEFPSSQMRLGAWIREYPNTLILQPDTVFSKEYDDLAGYDAGTIKGSLEKRDSSSWKKKSWVVGVVQNGLAKAYDWNDLKKEKIINDTLGSMPVVLVLENDSVTFHAFNRQINGQLLQFTWNDRLSVLQDINTHSSWSWIGKCMDGQLKTSYLTPAQSYQEFWHSWQTFHPGTTRYSSIKEPLQ